MTGLTLAPGQAVHVVGAGGAGMSAIALVLAEMGLTVSGSDLRPSRRLDRLALAGVRTTVGHDAAIITPDLDAVVVSTAVPDRNPEVRAARERAVPVLSRAQALASIAAVKRAIAVAGTHGKTTTASMLALVLRAAGLAPSFIVGGELNEVGTNAAWDDGDWLVVEADESDGTFLEIPATAGIVTSVEPDHLEHYGSYEGLRTAFDEFVADIDEVAVISTDDADALALARRFDAVTYGFDSRARYRIADYRPAGVGSEFTIERDGDVLGEFRLPIPGRHNAANATAAAVLAQEIGIETSEAVAALANFGGVSRRFQFRGERDGVTFVDDYAHLPAEVAAAISAAREGPWKRVVVVFQPHRYSRTEALAADFADSFVGADAVVVTDVYSAGEAVRPGVSGRLVLDAIQRTNPTFSIEYAAIADALHDVPERLAASGDLVLTLGAGDLTNMADVWLSTP